MFLRVAIRGKNREHGTAVHQPILEHRTAAASY